MDANLINLPQKTKLKALSKFITSRLYYQNQDSPLIKSYKNSFYCQDLIKATDGELTSTYCKNRWCPICNRNKTAELINKYLPTLETYPQLYFITLTRPNVSGDNLKAEIDYLISTFRKLMQTRKSKQFIKDGAIGIRKLECTHNPETGFHPHFHLLVSDFAFAEYIVNRWLKVNPTANIKAQDLKPTDGEIGSYIEIFKYFSKLLAKDKTTNKIYFDAKSMDIIFTAMRGRQVFQTIGNLKPIEPNQETTKEKSVIFNQETGELITDGCFKYKGNLNTIGYYNITDGSNLIELTTPNLIKELDNNLNFQQNEKTLQ